MDISVNRAAWLDTIAWAEGAHYNTLFGGRTFSDYSDHPLKIGAIPYGGSTTSAAGRYQFERGTWNGLKGRIKSILGYVNFGPKAQDQGALLLTQDWGALGAVDAGNVGSVGHRLGIEGKWQGFSSKSASQIQAYFDKAKAARASGGLPVTASDGGGGGYTAVKAVFSLNDNQTKILQGKASPEMKRAILMVAALVVIAAVLVNADIL